MTLYLGNRAGVGGIFGNPIFRRTVYIGMWETLRISASAGHVR